jgi:two-component system LytT family response regulator
MIIDDEPLARLQLRALLEEEPDIRILGEAGHLQEAIPAIKQLQPDLLFLDIKMRGGGGFEILANLSDPPAAIFVTAHDDFAIRAFEVHALDYLLKPVSPTRLREAIRRVKDQPSKALPAFEEEDLAFVPLGSSGQFAAVRDILFIKASGHYSEICCVGQKKRIVRQAFREWSDRLPPALFSQLDRGLIVNLSQLSSFTASSIGAEVLFSGSDEHLEIGNTAAKRLRKLLSSRGLSPINGHTDTDDTW